jgi:ribA/ribD-fused uncharacterized protein
MNQQRRNAIADQPQIPGILAFDDAHEYLSNFYPCRIVLDKKVYRTVEHAYQAAKTTDPDERRWVRVQSTPGKAKRAGKRITLRKDWDKVKIKVMTELVRQKFEDPKLLRKLVNTRNAYLAEGNNWGDMFWGTVNGTGQNHLGRILMSIRRPYLLGKEL